MEEYTQIELGFEDSIEKNLELPPEKRHLRGINHDDIQYKQISIRIGNHPIAYDFRKLCLSTNKNIPDEYQVFISYDIWLINYYIGVANTGGFNGIKQLGFRIKYFAPEFVNVIEILPKTEFIDLIDGKFTFQGDIGLSGSVKPSNLNLSLLNTPNAIKADGKIDLSADASLLGRMSFSVITPRIIVTGIGSNTSEWILNRDKNPLYGDIILTDIILVEKYKKKISIEAEVYATLGIYNLIPSRRTSPVVKLDFELEN